MLEWFLITYRNGKQIDIYTVYWLKKIIRFRRIEKIEIFNNNNKLLKTLKTKKELKEYFR